MPGMFATMLRRGQGVGRKSDPGDIARPRWGRHRLRPTGGSLALVCTDQNISKIFEITGLHKVFPIIDTLSEVGAP